MKSQTLILLLTTTLLPALAICAPAPAAAAIHSTDNKDMMMKERDVAAVQTADKMEMAQVDGAEAMKFPPGSAGAQVCGIFYPFHFFVPCHPCCCRFHPHWHWSLSVVKCQERNDDLLSSALYPLVTLSPFPPFLPSERTCANLRQRRRR